MTSNSPTIPSTQCGLTNDQSADYERDGVLLIRNVFSDGEIKRLADDAERVLQSHSHLLNENNLRTRFTPHHENGKPIFEKFDPFADLSDVAR